MKEEEAERKAADIKLLSQVMYISIGIVWAYHPCDNDHFMYDKSF